jgi:hypothetical protein
MAPPSSSTRHSWLPRGSEGLRYRLGVASRAVAAIVGGYALAGLAATVMALYLPTSRVEATLTGMLASFIIYTGAVMWVFAARTALRAWTGILAPSALLGAVLLVHFYAGGAS